MTPYNLTLRAVIAWPLIILLSGLLSREELRAGCELLAKHNGSISLSPEDLDNLVDTMDINKDGEINFNEFLESFRMVDNKFSNGNLWSWHYRFINGYVELNVHADKMTT